MGAISKYLSQAATASHFYPEILCRFLMVRKTGCLVTPPELSDGECLKVGLRFPTNKGLLVNFGKINIQRSTMQISSVTVCTACLWIQSALQNASIQA